MNKSFHVLTLILFVLVITVILVQSVQNRQRLEKGSATRVQSSLPETETPYFRLGEILIRN